MKAVLGRILGVRLPDPSMSDDSSARGSGAGELSRERNRRKLKGDWLLARLRDLSASFVEVTELERDFVFSLHSLRPLGFSSPVLLRERERADKPPMTELNASLPNEPELRVWVSLSGDLRVPVGEGVWGLCKPLVTGKGLDSACGEEGRIEEMVSVFNDAAESFRGREKREGVGLKMAEAETGLFLDLGVSSERVKLINRSSPLNSTGGAGLEVVVPDRDNS